METSLRDVIRNFRFNQKHLLFGEYDVLITRTFFYYCHWFVFQVQHSLHFFGIPNSSEWNIFFTRFNLKTFVIFHAPFHHRIIISFHFGVTNNNAAKSVTLLSLLLTISNFAYTYCTMYILSFVRIDRPWATQWQSKLPSITIITISLVYPLCIAEGIRMELFIKLDGINTVK